MDNKREVALEYIKELFAQKKLEKDSWKPSWIRTDLAHDDWILLRTGCQCLTPDHDLSVSIEVEDGFTQIGFNSNVGCYLYGRDLWRRFKIACKVLFTGDCEFEGSFIFKNKEQVEELFFAILWAREKVEENDLKCILGRSEYEPHDIPVAPV